MSSLTIVGIGPGPIDMMTREAEAALTSADRVLLRVSRHPVHAWLRDQGVNVLPLEGLYGMPSVTYEDLYELIVSVVLKEVELRESVVYAVPGNPFVAESTTGMLVDRCRRRGIKCRIVPGMSVLELIYSVIEVNPAEGLQIVLPRTHLATGKYTTGTGLLVLQVAIMESPRDRPRVTETMRWLQQRYPPDHEVVLVWTSGMPDYETHVRSTPLETLDRVYEEEEILYASLYVPTLSG